MRIRFEYNPWQSWLIGKAPPSFSYIPLSQCKRRAVCCRERLHVTVSGKIAILSPERAINCTNIQCFEQVSKYFCTERSLAWSSRIHTIFIFHRARQSEEHRLSSAFDAFSPGINRLLIMEFISLPFPTW